MPAHDNDDGDGRMGKKQKRTRLLCCCLTLLLNSLLTSNLFLF
jgi:hypothetical protein